MDISGSPPNSSESINGLKFGKKIYFEDVGTGIPSILGGGSSSVSVAGDLSPPYAAAKKVRSGGSVSGGGGSGQQVARCVVEGCSVDLSDLKAYYSRHKVCGMHSKSPKVIVAGIEQRFCQQCSRFHQLPEFDQGKRSCRRRLAGHNERRRKPPPGSLLPSRYGRHSSSVFENSGRGGFVMDFSAQQRLPERKLWPQTSSSSRSPELVHTSQTTATGNYPSSNAWQSNNTENHPSSNLFLQGSAGGAPGSFPNTPGIPPGEFYTGVSADSTRALSLLSNHHHHQSWDSSRNRVSGMNNHLNENATTIAHPHPMAWDGSHQIASDQDLNGQFSRGRQYMEVEHSRGYTSPTHHVHWSL